MVAAAGTGPVILRPHPHLFRQGLVAVVAFMAPVFVVLYALTIPDGPWRAVLATQLLATLLVVFSSISYFRLAVRVDGTSISEVGFFGRTTRVAAREIGSVFVADVFEESGTRALPQLFVCDSQGRQVIRMRGQFWSRESMETVLATLEVPQEAREHVVSTRELRDEYPGLLYWFERRPVVAALVFTTGVLATGAAIWAIFVLTGLT